MSFANKPFTPLTAVLSRRGTSARLQKSFGLQLPAISTSSDDFRPDLSTHSPQNASSPDSPKSTLASSLTELAQLVVPTAFGTSSSLSTTASGHSSSTSSGFVFPSRWIICPSSFGAFPLPNPVYYLPIPDGAACFALAQGNIWCEAVILKHRPGVLLPRVECLTSCAKHMLPLPAPRSRGRPLVYDYLVAFLPLHPKHVRWLSFAEVTVTLLPGDMYAVPNPQAVAISGDPLAIAQDSIVKVNTEHQTALKAAMADSTISDSNATVATQQQQHSLSTPASVRSHSLSSASSQSVASIFNLTSPTLSVSRQSIANPARITPQFLRQPATGFNLHIFRVSVNQLGTSFGLDHDKYLSLLEYPFEPFVFPPYIAQTSALLAFTEFVKKHRTKLSHLVQHSAQSSLGVDNSSVQETETANEEAQSDLHREEEEENVDCNVQDSNEGQNYVEQDRDGLERHGDDKITSKQPHDADDCENDQQLSHRVSAQLQTPITAHSSMTAASTVALQQTTDVNTILQATMFHAGCPNATGSSLALTPLSHPPSIHALTSTAFLPNIGPQWAEQQNKQLDSLQFGPWRLPVWYVSEFPEMRAGMNTMFMCEWCLRYMQTLQGFQQHLLRCVHRHPPGTLIYTVGNIDIWEVDGRKERLYCQCLCLLARCFLDSKTVIFDTDDFLFYVLTLRPTQPFQLGYASWNNATDNFSQLYPMTAQGLAENASKTTTTEPPHPVPTASSTTSSQQQTMSSSIPVQSYNNTNVISPGAAPPGEAPTDSQPSFRQKSVNEICEPLPIPVSCPTPRRDALLRNQDSYRSISTSALQQTQSLLADPANIPRIVQAAAAPLSHSTFFAPPPSVTTTPQHVRFEDSPHLDFNRSSSHVQPPHPVPHPLPSFQPPSPQSSSPMHQLSLSGSGSHHDSLGLHSTAHLRLSPIGEQGESSNMIPVFHPSPTTTAVSIPAAAITTPPPTAAFVPNQLSPQQTYIAHAGTPPLPTTQQHFGLLPPVVALPAPIPLVAPAPVPAAPAPIPGRRRSSRAAAQYAAASIAAKPTKRSTRLSTAAATAAASMASNSNRGRRKKLDSDHDDDSFWDQQSSSSSSSSSSESFSSSDEMIPTAKSVKSRQKVGAMNRRATSTNQQPLATVPIPVNAPVTDVQVQYFSSVPQGPSSVEVAANTMVSSSVAPRTFVDHPSPLPPTSLQLALSHSPSTLQMSTSQHLPATQLPTQLPTNPVQPSTDESNQYADFTPNTNTLQPPAPHHFTASGINHPVLTVAATELAIADNWTLYPQHDLTNSPSPRSSSFERTTSQHQHTITRQSQLAASYSSWVVFPPCANGSFPAFTAYNQLKIIHAPPYVQQNNFPSAFIPAKPSIFTASTSVHSSGGNSVKSSGGLGIGSSSGNLALAAVLSESTHIPQTNDFSSTAALSIASSPSTTGSIYGGQTINTAATNMHVSSDLATAALLSPNLVSPLQSFCHGRSVFSWATEDSSTASLLQQQQNFSNSIEDSYQPIQHLPTKHQHLSKPTLQQPQPQQQQPQQQQQQQQQSPLYPPLPVTSMHNVPLQGNPYAFGTTFVGYFSKEKCSSERHNLSCIVTLPQFQGQGYGRLLIDLSYQLTKLQGTTGSPEKPLSKLGLLSYRAYWVRTILRAIIELTSLAEQQTNETTASMMSDNDSASSTEESIFSPSISLQDLAMHTGIEMDDCVTALQCLGIAVKSDDGWSLLCSPQQLIALCELYIPGLMVSSTQIVQNSLPQNRPLPSSSSSSSSSPSPQNDQQLVQLGGNDISSSHHNTQQPHVDSHPKPILLPCPQDYPNAIEYARALLLVFEEYANAAAKPSHAAWTREIVPDYLHWIPKVYRLQSQSSSSSSSSSSTQTK